MGMFLPQWKCVLVVPKVEVRGVISQGRVKIPIELSGTSNFF